MENNNQFSPPPVIEPIIPKKTMTFPDAIKEVIAGFKITRKLWNDTQEYGILVDGWLTIHTKGVFHKWLVNDGDLLADDWKVC